MNNTVIILAGGSGKRMNSDIPKVLHNINNEPMIVTLLKEVSKINSCKILVVVGEFKELIEKELKKYNFNITFVLQNKPLGTGDAVKCCKEHLEDNSNVLILSGDTPIITLSTMNNFLKSNSLVKLGITNLQNPYGYGRIIEKNNLFHKITEEKDCSDVEKQIKKVNCGIYMIHSYLIKKYIFQIECNNNQNEYYLTDLIEIIKNKENLNIEYHIFKNNYETMGVNTQEQLKELQNKLNNNNCEYDPPWFI